MKNITTCSRLDEYVSEMSILSRDNAVGVPNPGIKIVALVIVANGEIIVKRRNEATGGISNPNTHAEKLCIKSKDFPEKGVIKSIYITIPPCKFCRELIDKEGIKNVYYLFDRNNQANRPWNKSKDRARVKEITMNNLNESSKALINEIKMTFNKNDKEAKKIQDHH
ncbi:MAG: hypothetical protein KAG14_04835 [Mycoplasmataceae bacterium]|nr:hypothetical protein [Mycoplasmataceae bacterium]